MAAVAGKHVDAFEKGDGRRVAAVDVIGAQRHFGEAGCDTGIILAKKRGLPFDRGETAVDLVAVNSRRRIGPERKPHLQPAPDHLHIHQQHTHQSFPQ
ncbi:hypothetical protein D3C80_1866380 [compost metagenome]